MNAGDRYKRWVPVAVALVLCIAATTFEHVLPAHVALSFGLLLAPVILWYILIGLPLILTPRTCWSALVICWVILVAWPLAIYGASIASSCDAHAVTVSSWALLTIAFFVPVDIFANVGYWLALLFVVTFGSMLIERTARWCRPTAIWSLQFVLTVPLIYWIAEVVWRSAGMHPVPGYCMGL